MKKKLLFIMDTFPLGGISKSLLALFNELGDRYEIDFLLMKQEGLFLPLIPEFVTLLPEPVEEVFRNPHPKYMIKALKELSFARWIQWLAYSAACTTARIFGGLHKQVQVMDVRYAKLAKGINKHYDAGIAYQGGRCIYYLADQVDAEIKIGYVHNDYSASEIDYMMKPSDEKYFPKMDYLITISPHCLESLKQEFPNIKHKCCVVENICSVKMLRNMAEREKGFSDNYAGVKLITMGRFDIRQKGIDYAILTARILKKCEIDFKWYFLGDGRERTQIEALIRDSGVEDCFILLGAKINPYPYIREADIYVQPSRYEGKSVALDEVKALMKPIVVTNFSTVYDQFTDGKNALIAQMDPKDIAEKIMLLINDKTLRCRLTGNLAREKVGNEEQAQVFERLLIRED